MKRYRKIVILLLVVALTFGVIAISVSASEPFKIGCVDDLLAFADKVAQENCINAELTCDLDLSGRVWTPISSYAGTFDGGGFTISNMQITPAQQDGAVNAGLFAELNGGTVRNLVLEGSISFDSTAQWANAGGLVGICNDGKLVNCTFTGDLNVSAAERCAAGGLAGRLQGEGALISNCGYLSGTIRVSCNKANGGFAGGLVGVMSGDGLTAEMRSTLSNCYAAGTVDKTVNAAAARLGALVGYADQYTVIDSCYCAASNPLPAMESNGTVTNCEKFNAEYIVALQTGDMLLLDCLNAQAADLQNWEPDAQTGQPKLFLTRESPAPSPTPTVSPSSPPEVTPTPTPQPTPTVQPTPPVQLRVVNPLAVSRPYDGTTLVTVTAEGLDGVLDGDEVFLTSTEVEGTAAAAAAGEHPVAASFALAGADSEKYTLVQPAADALNVIIQPRVVELVWSSDSETYTGRTIQVTATVTNAVDGDTVEITSYIGNTGVDYGDYRARVTGVSNANYTCDGVLEHSWQITKAVPELTLFDIQIGADGAKVSVKEDVRGLGSFRVLYEESESVPTQPGTYSVYIEVGEGKNYQAARLPAGSFQVPEKTAGGVIGGGPSGPKEQEPIEEQDESVHSFADVDEERWSYGAIQRVAGLGLMTGVDDSRFVPQGSASRAMLVTTLWRYNGAPEVTERPGYTDISQEKWYYTAVAWAAARSIVQGFDDGTFRPDAALTREQAIVILMRLLDADGKAVESTDNIAEIRDFDACGAWARADLERAAACGLLRGDGKQLCRPKDVLSREELAALLCRYMDLAEAA